MRFDLGTRFSRVPYVAPCTLRLRDRERHGLICNLSVLGLYVHVQPIPDGEVLIRFRLPDGGATVEALAQVTWVNDSSPDSMAALPAGCGLRFSRIALEDQQRLERVVRLFQTEREPVVGLSQPKTGNVRVPWISPCRLVGTFGIAHGTTCNLSELGIYAAVEPIPQVGDSVAVSFALPRRPEPFRCEAEVTWQNLEHPDRPQALPPGCGLRFENLTGADRTMLSALVSEYLRSLATRF